MQSVDFYYKQKELESEGFALSKRFWFDLFHRDYISRQDCDNCDRHGLQAIIMRKKGKVLTFGRCRHCKHVFEIT